MTFRTSRLTSRRARRLPCAALALIYFWAFAALGLTHTHGAARVATHRAAPALTLAGAPTTVAQSAPPGPDDDSTCPLCAAAHAAPAALAQPPRPAAAPSPARCLAVTSLGNAPSRTPQASRSRGPPPILA